MTNPAVAALAWLSFSVGGAVALVLTPAAGPCRRACCMESDERRARWMAGEDVGTDLATERARELFTHSNFGGCSHIVHGVAHRRPSAAPDPKDGNNL